MSNFVKPSSDVGDSCGFPVVHHAVDPPEVAVSPDWHCNYHKRVPQLVFVPVQVPCIDVSCCIQDHNHNFPEGAAKDSADRVEYLAPQMLCVLIVLGELERAEGRSDGRVDDEELPCHTEGEADEHVPCCNLEDPVVVTKTAVTAQELLNCRVALLHLLLNWVEVVAKESEHIERDHSAEPVNPVREVAVRASNCVVNAHAVLSLRLLEAEYAWQVREGPDLDAKDLRLVLWSCLFFFLTHREFRILSFES